LIETGLKLSLSVAGSPARRWRIFLPSAEFVDAKLRQAGDFRSERLTVDGRPSLHDRASASFSAMKSVSKPMCGPPLGRKVDRSNDTHIARFAARSQSRGRSALRG
jgi:hypothetical protein